MAIFRRRAIVAGDSVAIGREVASLFEGRYLSEANMLRRLSRISKSRGVPLDVVTVDEPAVTTATALCMQTADKIVFLSFRGGV